MNTEKNDEMDFSTVLSTIDENPTLETDPKESAPPMRQVNRKRRYSVGPRSPSEPHSNMEDQEVSGENPNDIYSDECPEGINPILWRMLISIKKDTAKCIDNVDDLANRVYILEDTSDHVGSDIHNIKKDMVALIRSNDVLRGRLLRAETIIERQRSDITDLRSRSMRDNIIVKTKGQTYKEDKDENTTSKFQTFLDKELHIHDATRIDIPRAHRMGRAINGYNRMMIAKVPNEDDKRRIFANANVLNNTDYSISHQIPQEIEERRIFGWQLYKKARQEGRYARFDQGRLYVDNTAITKVDPISLPPISTALDGITDKSIPTGNSEPCEVAQHVFKAWAAPTTSLQGVREGLDVVLVNGLAGANFAPYAFRFQDTQTGTCENFESDGDNGMGLTILKTLKEKQVKNVAVYVSHVDIACKPITMKEKTAAAKQVVEDALIKLGRLCHNN